ncbi:atrial natriuretic peptide receptor 1-like [Mytilus trossulus]|uniref:atrial natriuretic peptide receptor 1-like n=1 Tax=Mytilus trossulus TaxID=6551 RepID=UPI0030076AA5
MEITFQYLFLVTLSSEFAWSWHNLDNVDYHCWSLSASAEHPTPHSPVCTGLNLRWTEHPPVTVKMSQGFNTTTELILTIPFYQWLIDQGFFGQANFTQGISNVNDAKDWCETTTCPAPSAATQENCCIHHMNLHSCPLTDITNGLCGPWIPARGQIITHSEVLVGNALVGNWTNYVPGLYVLGQTSIISHFKIAGASIALVYDLTVEPKTDCGNGVCESDDGEDCSVCPKDCGTCPLEDWHYGLIAASILFIFILIGAIYGYFAYQKRKLLYDSSWIYKYDDIKTNENRLWMGSMISRTDDKFDTGFNLTQVFVPTGDVDGKTVAIKRIEKKSFSLTKCIREEVRTVRQMDHQNVCRFVGGCIEVPNVAILMTYCAKGSLNDVLLNEEVPLSWSFRFSFATDISRGMKYLHSHKIIHGRLWSSNCVMDDRWSVKVTDYGLETFRKSGVCEDENIKKQKQVYLEPELVKSQAIPTEHSDVYAFSVILIEIATRGDPFQEEDPYSVPIDWQPPLPVFEKTSDENNCPCPDEYCKLISICRSHNPIERPSFESIKRRLQRINPNKQNPVDLIITMMEKYSKHLESVVAERTQDLMAEKHRTETLLYSMLPRSVADSLKTGLSVQAESFDQCTIYFSDIVGFTVLCSKSSALEVVGLLNRLYTVFDEIIENFCVYKVETIGDAYMVASGLPKRTPNHASEIAQMSLKIVEAAKHFKIPHLPNAPLKIRIGLHSGYVCAGVVGRTMPRYCLFGDTVNTASRMESNGEPYKIHISDDTYSELAITGGFQVEERGVISVKGKGDMRTWWLTGYDPCKMDKKQSLIENSQGYDMF